MIGDIQLSEMVRDEILQRRQEGCTVPAYAIEHAEDAELNRTNQNLSCFYTTEVPLLLIICCNSA